MLTILAGLRENVVLTFVTGRFSHIRSRLTQGRINYRIAQLDLLPDGMLPDLLEVGSSYNFYHTPTRSPENLGDDRNVCVRINSVSAPSLALYYDDFFGSGPRREQVFLYSISAPHCDVINFDPAWLADSVQTKFLGNTSAFERFVSTNFDTLRADRSVHVGAVNDFGAIGVPFLRCIGRPAVAFQFTTDHLVLQSFWAGGGYHVEIQSSECWANPVLSNDRSGPVLYRVEAADASAKVLVAMPPHGFVVQAFSIVYAVVALGFITRGIFGAVFGKRQTRYLTWQSRRFHLPSLHAELLCHPTSKRSCVLQFLGDSTAGANSWLNHWVYITLSIINAALNVRPMYALLEVGTWVLTKHVLLDNFLFVCAALTKLTWLSCLAHTALRRALHLLLDVLTVLLPWGRRGFEFFRWYVDAVALFSNFKFYLVFLAIQLYCLLQINGSTTVMVKRPGFKRPVYGGEPGLASMWGSEIACDLVVICCVQLATAHVLATILLLTRMRHATTNRALRLLQQRYCFVGWDALVTSEALRMDIRDGVASTHCTLAAWTRQLYASGPSGWVHFAGDEAFEPSPSLTKPAPVSRCQAAVAPTPSHASLVEPSPSYCDLELHAESPWGALWLTPTTNASQSHVEPPKSVFTTLSRGELERLAQGALRIRI